MGKRSRAVLPLLLLLLLPLMVVKAHPRSGSITVLLTMGEDVTSGAEVTLYRVGEPEGDGYLLSEAFRFSGISLEDVHSGQTAAELAEFARLNLVQGEAAVAETGKHVTFSGLSEGLYLVANTAAGDGAIPFCPFLVSLPLYVNGAAVYEITAAPKLSPGVPDEPDQPQTGDHTLPGLYLGIGALIISPLFLALLLTGKKKY